MNIFCVLHLRKLHSYIRITRDIAWYIIAPDQTYEVESKTKLHIIKTMDGVLSQTFLFQINKCFKEDKSTPISFAISYSFLESQFLRFMPIQSRHTYWKFAYGILKLGLWFLGVELVVVDGVHWILRGDLFASPQRMVPENDTCWQIAIDVEYYDIHIFSETHNDFQVANCVWKDRNI